VFDVGKISTNIDNKLSQTVSILYKRRPNKAAPSDDELNYCNITARNA